MTTDSHHRDRYTGSPTHDQPERSRSAGDMLPPVQPPAASFLMQLFVTPMIIVALIVSVWFLVAWVARPSDQVENLVAGLETLNHRSWQQALQLANRLRDVEATDLRHDPDTARRLANVLTVQMQTAQPTEEQRTLQIYLCRALGEFEISEPVETLVAAAQDERPRDPAVRRGAIQAIGMLASHLESAELADNDRVVNLLIKASEQAPTMSADEESILESQRLRSTATFVLGLIGGDQANRRLESLLSDSSEDVRYNAALGLARIGNPRCIEPILKMLAMTETSEAVVTREAAHSQDGGTLSVSESPRASETWRRELVVASGLRAVATLAARHPSLDLAPFVAPVSHLSKDPSLAGGIRQEAREVERLLRQTRSTPPSAADSAAERSSLDAAR